MYHPVNVQKLSHPQILKLLKGDRVNIKHGSGQVLHLSQEQYTKHGKATQKGCGHIIRFDPWQVKIHHKLAPSSRTASRVSKAMETQGGALMPAGYGIRKAPKRGRGFWGNLLKSGLNAAAPIAKEAAKDLAKDLAPKAIDAGADFLGKKLGFGARKTPKSHRKTPKRGKGWQEDLMGGIETALPYVERYAPLALSLL